MRACVACACACVSAYCVHMRVRACVRALHMRARMCVGLPFPVHLSDGLRLQTCVATAAGGLKAVTSARLVSPRGGNTCGSRRASAAASRALTRRPRPAEALGM